MYTTFYNLNEKPFNLTPSPRFLYLGEAHKEALALLTYGVMERKGFILLTGEVGTGKTTIIHTLIRNLDKRTRYVYLSNPLLSPTDFTDYLAYSVFKKRARFRSKTDFLVAFEAFLKQCLHHQQIFILIVDEAQNLSFELLEEIRLLSNMESSEEKLLNIFLVGQPELNNKLQQPRCRALLQRISSRYHIPPLNREDVLNYITTRLKKAGASNKNEIFSSRAVKEIHQLSGGYPRMINILADSALLLGYSQGKARVSQKMVEQCFKDVQLDGTVSTGVPDRQKQIQERTSAKRWILVQWKWAVIIVLLIICITLIWSIGGKGRISGLDKLFSLHTANQIDNTGRESGRSSTHRYPINGNSTESKSIQTKAYDVQRESDTIGLSLIKKDLHAKPSDEPPSDNITKEPLWKTEKIQSQTNENTQPTFLIVKEGDTLKELAITVYGRSDGDVIDFIRKKNPAITDINQIHVGQKIKFPPLIDLDKNLTYTLHIASFKPFANAQILFKQLTTEGYEAYIIPAYDKNNGRVYRVALGNFEHFQDAEAYGSILIERGVSDYAKPVQLEMR